MSALGANHASVVLAPHVPLQHPMGHMSVRRTHAYLYSNRKASPCASVHHARAAAAQMHAQLNLLKPTLLQTRRLTAVCCQTQPAAGVPDLIWQSCQGWSL